MVIMYQIYLNYMIVFLLSREIPHSIRTRTLTHDPEPFWGEIFITLFCNSFKIPLLLYWLT